VSRALLALVMLFWAALPPVVTAQDAQVRMELRQEPSQSSGLTLAPIVRPVPSAAALARDAARAAEEIAARERAEKIIREQGVPGIRPVPRPDLNEDVVGGIQTRNLHRTFGR
jgi:hypothetical protein